MKTKLLSIGLIIMVLLSAYSCEKKESIKGEVNIPAEDILDNKVLTADEQAALSPDSVIAILKQGNREFVEDALTVRNNTDRVREAALGHEHCGAIKSAIQDVEMGNITALLSKIKPAVLLAREHFDGEAVYSNPEFMHAVCTENVVLTVADIRARSPILKELENKGEIKIIGAVYDMDTGEVDFFD